MLRENVGSIVAPLLVLVLALGCDEGPDDDGITTAPACTAERGCPEGSVCVQGLYCRSRGDTPAPPPPGPGSVGQPDDGSDGGIGQLDGGTAMLDGGTAILDGGVDGRDGGIARGSDAGACVGALLACDGVCIDPQSDALNCGGCGIACTGGRPCNGGVCCDATHQVCGQSCVDLSRDPTNCGTCGLVCPAGTECSLGACVTPLPGGSI